VLDFTSALYLGMRHASEALRPWAQFTTGVPAILAAPAGTTAVANKLAELAGCERATLAPSTLHLFWDLFGIVAKDAVAIYMDAGVYPIVKWGVERAAACGVPVRNFPHHDALALRRLVQQDAHQDLSPVVVTDGFCPACSRIAPISAYLKLIRQVGGYLILDDTQALGILGHSPERGVPYGKGGGGSLRWCNASGPDILLISSLAKGFGVPVAVLAGSKAMIRNFEAKSETRVHCSPPSVAVIRAAEHALAENEEMGDTLRMHLAQRVKQFRDRLARAGFSTSGGLFPVQTLALAPGLEAETLHERLLQQGVRTVLHNGRHRRGARLSFVITALHTAGDIDRAVQVLAHTAAMK
jgi:8-amino-7-oxononanoate synthase